MSVEKKLDENIGDQPTAMDAPVSDRRAHARQALEKIRAGIIQRRGSLEGILDELLAERRLEAQREIDGE
jgi:hypothetical protein